MDTDMLEELMQEAPHGPNHGRRAQRLRTDEDGEFAGQVTRAPLDDQERSDWLMTEGHIVERGTAHRGVLHRDEYVNGERLLEEFERRFGFTRAQVLSVYRQGKLSQAQAELRASIDARMLGLSRSGANMAAVARLLGLPIDKQRHCRMIQNAIARAQEVER